MKKKMKNEEAFTEQEFHMYREDEIDREMFLKENKKGKGKKKGNKRRMVLRD